MSADEIGSHERLRLLFVLEPLPTLVPGHDSSVSIIEAAQRRGHTVHVTTMQDLEVLDGKAYTIARQLRVTEAVLTGGKWIASTDWYELFEEEQLSVETFDAVFIRTDPPVDDDYIRGTYVLDLVDTRRTLMINNPSGLREANEKFFALRMPELGPPTRVTACASRVVSWAMEWGKAVMKPTNAMAGRGVLILDATDPNLRSLAEVGTGYGKHHVIVQKWIQDAALGDRRVIVLDGRPIGVVRRVADGLDFRCNMASGAVPTADSVTDADVALCARLAPELRRLGLIFVGLDVIGGLLTEVNVTSPTGLREIDALSGTHLGDEITRWVETHTTKKAVA